MEGTGLRSKTERKFGRLIGKSNIVGVIIPAIRPDREDQNTAKVSGYERSPMAAVTAVQ